MARENEFDANLLRSVETRNEKQKHLLGDKIQYRFGNDLDGKRIAIWGLSFKPGTDDMREAPSLILINHLIEAGAEVNCYDPVAVGVAKKMLPVEAQKSGKIKFAEDQYSALENADAMVLVTEWKPFQRPDFSRIGSAMKQKIIFDGRNQYNPEQLAERGFEYYGIGRSSK